MWLLGKADQIIISTQFDVQIEAILQSKARVRTFKVRLKKVGKHWSELVDTVRVVLFAVFQECDIGPLTNTHTRDVLFRKCFLQILHHVKYVLWKQCGTKPTLIPNAHSQAQVTLLWVWARAGYCDDDREQRSELFCVERQGTLCGVVDELP